MAGGTAEGIQTAWSPLASRPGSERSMKTPSTTSTIQIQSVETRYLSTKGPGLTPAFSPLLAHSPPSSLFQNTFVGLTNLGATCYVNTFLQVWFHNLELRWSLYECNSSRAQEHDTGSGTSDTCVAVSEPGCQLRTRLLSFVTAVFRL